MCDTKLFLKKNKDLSFNRGHNCALQRRFWDVTVICVIELACVVGRGGKGGQRGLSKGPEMGQLTLSIGPARVEVCSYKQRATIPSHGLPILYIKHLEISCIQGKILIIHVWFIK